MLSLVKQISCLEPGKPIIDPLPEMYEQRRLEGFASGSLSLEECTEIIIDVTEHRPLTVIVIDALDECDEEKRYSLLEALKEILRRAEGLVKVFLSSRDDQDIVDQLVNGSNIEIETCRNQIDINRFVQHEVVTRRKAQKFRCGSISDSLEYRMQQELCDGAQGM